MILIDLDAVLKTIPNEEMVARMAVMSAPPVDAVPIEWLRQKQTEHSNDGFEWIYDEIINEWEKEKNK